nr:hypothetical protein [Candidatus Freyarchaeota archaeon]
MVSGITRELAKALLREAEIDLESAKNPSEGEEVSQGCFRSLTNR